MRGVLSEPWSRLGTSHRKPRETHVNVAVLEHLIAPSMFTNVVVLSGSLQIRFTGTHLHGKISGSHSIYMGRWLILELYGIYMGRLVFYMPFTWGD